MGSQLGARRGAEQGFCSRRAGRRAPLKTGVSQQRKHHAEDHTFLTYDHQAEEAAKLYVSVFKNSRIRNVTRYGQAGPGPKGSVMTVTFELDGQEFVALNGGPHFKFTDGVSLSVDCKTQEEIDAYWETLSEGGEKGPCGWLKDKFGLWWQINPRSSVRCFVTPILRKRSAPWERCSI